MKTLVAVALIFLGLGLLVLEAQGTCFRKLAKPGATVCTATNGRAVKPGKTVMVDCFRCHCGTNRTLSCCGTGRYAGTIGVPRHCRVIPQGKCGFKIVMRNDNTLPCA